VKKKTDKKSLDLEKRGFLAQAVAALSASLVSRKVLRVKTPAGSIARAKNNNGEKLG